jgi:uncharacterized membrane protein YphA (DoxX/SURF4 family)
MNRLLLAMAFIPTGLVKATGQRFTILPVDNPVGFFFEAMYQTGPFWHFIGIMQIAAGVLLLIPATATLGAVLFVPIIFSIVLITWGIGFGGTVYVTTLMLLAAIYLVCWDADRIWAGGSMLLGTRSGPGLLDGASRAETTGWILGGVAGIMLFMSTRGFVPTEWRLPLLAIGGLCFLVVVGSWIVHVVRGVHGSPNPPSEPEGQAT